MIDLQNFRDADFDLGEADRGFILQTLLSKSARIFARRLKKYGRDGLDYIYIRMNWGDMEEMNLLWLFLGMRNPIKREKL